MGQSKFLSVGRHARVSRLSETDKAWMKIAVNSRCTMEDFLKFFVRDGSFGRTCLASYQATEGGHSEYSSGSWPNAGLACAGECLTASISESPSDGVACSLSDILEDNGGRPQRFFLTPKAIEKMLSRLHRYGGKRPSPEILEAFGVTHLGGLETPLLNSESA